LAKSWAPSKVFYEWSVAPGLEGQSKNPRFASPCELPLRAAIGVFYPRRGEKKGLAHLQARTKKRGLIMKKNSYSIGSTPGFEAVSTEEQMLVEGGLSWSGIWSAIKGAANWVKNNVFIDFGSKIFGWKGTW
jgi:hypothetical protein